MIGISLPTKLGIEMWSRFWGREMEYIRMFFHISAHRDELGEIGDEQPGSREISI
jgi:hypothetical protein